MYIFIYGHAPLICGGPLSGNVGINLCGPGHRGWTLDFGGSQGGRETMRTFSLQTRRPNWESLGSRGVSDFKGICLVWAWPAAQNTTIQKVWTVRELDGKVECLATRRIFETGGGPHIMLVRSCGAPVAPHVVPHVFGLW